MLSAYASVTIPIPRNFYGRRLYVMFNGTGAFVVDAQVIFTLSGRKVFQMPYLVSSASGLSVFLPGGAAASNPARQNSIQANFGATAYIIHAWELTIAADKMEVAVNSFTTPGLAHQFVGIQSEHRW